MSLTSNAPRPCKRLIPHRCCYCKCSLWATKYTTVEQKDKNYVYHSGKYYCLDCYPTYLKRFRKANLLNKK